MLSYSNISILTEKKKKLNGRTDDKKRTASGNQPKAYVSRLSEKWTAIKPYMYNATSPLWESSSCFIQDGIAHIAYLLRYHSLQ